MPVASLISADLDAKCCYGNKTISPPNQLKQEVGFFLNNEIVFICPSPNQSTEE